MYETILELWARHSPAILDMGRRILIAALIVIGGRIVINIGSRIIKRAGTGRLKLDETIASILKMVLTYATVIVCVIMILDDFGFNTTGLIALLGTAGVAIGFALKDTLSNIAFGIMILFLKPFRNGDFIEFGLNMGQVKKIGLFTTELETADGVYISATNASLWGTPLKNHSHGSRRCMELSVRIPPDGSLDDAHKIFKDLIAEEKRFLPNPAPQILFQSLGNNGTNIVLRAWIISKGHSDLHGELVRKVKEKTEAAGITVSVSGR